MYDRTAMRHLVVVTRPGERPPASDCAPAAEGPRVRQGPPLEADKQKELVRKLSVAIGRGVWPVLSLSLCRFLRRSMSSAATLFGCRGC